MLYCDDVLSLLETLSTSAEHFYIGKLDNKKDKSIGVYSGDRLPSKISLGGTDCNLHDVQRFTILVHWNSNPHDTEINSKNIYTLLESVSNVDINSKHIYYISMLYNEPVDVFTDDKGIYERVIDIQVYSRKD